MSFELELSFGGGAVEFGFLLRELLAPCCLTIASEGRETWAAGSLRDFDRWAGFLARAKKADLAV
jgi:hypothetical protein